MELKPGTRWKSVVCTTEVIVVRPPQTAGSLTCGGAGMVAQASTADRNGAPAADAAGGTSLGKRYASEDGLQVLCTKAGAGSLALNGQPLGLLETKKLPASD